MSLQGAPGPLGEVALDTMSHTTCGARQNSRLGVRSQASSCTYQLSDRTSHSASVSLSVLSYIVEEDILSHPDPWVKIKLNNGKYKA